VHRTSWAVLAASGLGNFIVRLEGERFKINSKTKKVRKENEESPIIVLFERIETPALWV